MADWQQLFDGVYTWRVKDPIRELWYNGFYLQLIRGALLIDPPRLELTEQLKLEKVAYPDGMALTTRHNERHARWFLDRYDVDCIAHSDEANHFSPGMVVHLGFDEGDYIYGELEVIHLPGRTDGEMALYLRREGGILFLGGGVIGDPPGDLSFYFPRSGIDDLGRLKDSLLKLEAYPCEHVLVGEGIHVLNAGQSKLNRLMGSIARAR